MTEEDRLLLNDLNANAKQIFSLYADLETENQLLKANILDLNAEIEKLEHDKLELGRKIKNLKIASGILSGIDENREAKLKINRLIREIDKCIALLNR